MTKVAWDYTHQEFTITDYYYFSILQRACKENGILVDEVTDWSKLAEYDVIVFNYPEKPFTPEEVGDVKKLVEAGKRVVILGYYKNEDFIADTVNSLATAFGLRMNPDEVTDPESNHGGDPYFVVTGKVYGFNDGVEKLMLACTPSISLEGENTEVLIEGEPSAVSNKGFKPVLGALYRHPSGGEFIVVGTCVFWDNYSIERYSNQRFALNLLKR
ncbi:MAG: ThuA domain-containing protein [Aquificae bacterium]|nr:ThuA domain-containing protein [Aquificota bacterium]